MAIESNPGRKREVIRGLQVGCRTHLCLARPLPPPRQGLGGHHCVFRCVAARRIHPAHRQAHRKGLKSMRINFESDSETEPHLLIAEAK